MLYILHTYTQIHRTFESKIIIFVAYILHIYYRDQIYLHALSQLILTKKVLQNKNYLPLDMKK